jgi:hypothetical protein
MLKICDDLFIQAGGAMYSTFREYLALPRRDLKNHRHKAGLRAIGIVILP